jgi:threonine dehydrogenase-like Zn-dependent dehydrogenase
MLALEVYRSLPRYAAARAVGHRLPGLLAGPVAPLRLVNRDEPDLPGPGWTRVAPRLAGICGSDLATLAGSASFYFTPLITMPFVPGHEVVGELVADCEDLPRGTRVVLDPLLGCLPRGLEPCQACASGAANRCDRVTVGHVAPGLQTGYCGQTGGGWSATLAAHRSQLHPVPDALPDARAVLVEPLACAVHAAARARVPDGGSVVVVGAGAVGLLTTLALRAVAPAGPITVVAKHPKQADLAKLFGATTVLRPGEVTGGVRRATRALRLEPERGADFLLGGVDVAIDAAGTRSGLDTALRLVHAGGRVVCAAMPAAGADLTPAWFRELEVVGTYAGGPAPDGRPAFDVALELAAEAPLDGLVADGYPLHRWREAVDHALSAGRLGTVKVAFEPRSNS